MSWFGESYRKIHWDFDNPAYVLGIGEKFDAGAFLAELAKGRVSAVQLFAKDIFGHAYYDTKVGIRHPKLRFDLVKTVADACRRGGIRLLLYYTVMVDDYAARSHPAWRLNDGQNDIEWDACRCGMLCQNTPYVDQWVIPQLREMTEAYQPDGIFFDHVWAWRRTPCRCKYCQKQYDADIGGEIPRSEHDPKWSEYRRWRYERVLAVLSKYADAIHALKPDVMLGANHVSTAESPLSPNMGMDYLIEESADPLLNSFHARYLASSGFPFAVMNTRFVRSWGDWSLLPATALKQEFAPIIANGGTCWLGDKMYPDGRLDSYAYDEIGQAYRFVEEREPYVRGATAVPYIAILNTSTSHYLAQSRGMIPLRGAHKALVESGYHCSMLNEQTLLTTIRDYKTLVLADQPYLSSELQQAIRDFVRQGGGLIASYTTSARNDTGELQADFGLADVFGATLKGPYHYSVGLGEETARGTNYAYVTVADEVASAGFGRLPLLVHGRFLYATPTTGRPVASLLHHLNPEDAPDLFAFGDGPPGEDSGYPAVIMNTYGKGKVAYIAGEICSAYWNSNAAQLKYLLRNLIDAVTPEKVIEIDAPPCVEVSLARQGSRLIVHLVNYHMEKTGAGRPFAEVVPPIRDIGVRMPLQHSPRSVTQMPEGRAVPWTFERGMLRASVPELGIHSCLVVEM